MPLSSSLLKELHRTKNVELDISKIGLTSKRKVWWIDSLGHEWEASIGNRVKGSNCPYCSGNKVLAGFNDLATLNPALGFEWHPTLNGELAPSQVSLNSRKKVWWLCEKGHSHEASPNTRISMKTNCPYCSGKRTLKGFNDLATTQPSLAAQWHPTKNNSLLATQVTKSSAKKVWWLGKCGHEWEAVISSESRGHGCPYCAGKKTSSGKTDLATLHPHLLKEWDFGKNIEFVPTQISPFSKKLVWWKCEKGHEWKVSVNDRTTALGCPICSNRRLLIGYNDLSSINNKIASEWHPIKNGTLTPANVLSGSNAKAWWQCEKSHSWKSPISARVRGYGCPNCAKQISKAEEEIVSYLDKSNLVTETNVRSILPSGKELDIYVPSKKFAIEYNGVYWHDENHKEKTYHYNKWLECKQKGIQLIQVWEDDWDRNPELIKTMLSHKLGVSTQPKIFARKTEVASLTTKQAQGFLNDNHIQGFANGTHYIGLNEKGDIEKLVAVLVLKKEAGAEGKTLNIIRYATSQNVVGGFTKLLKHAETTFTPERFITFSDNCVSDGGLYENNGFIADKQLKPDYMYVFNHQRNHKFGYRLKSFKNNPELLWEEGLSESQLAKLNNLPRIWDAGKTRWVKETKYLLT